MNQTTDYSNELRADTATILFPVIGGMTALGALMAALAFDAFSISWHLWLSIALAITGGLLGRRYLNQNQATRGTVVFTGLHLIVFYLVILREWTPGSMLPYLAGALIIASSMFTKPRAGFVTWTIATILTAIGISQTAEGSANLFQAVIGPALANFLIAAAAYFSALEWQIAVESVSALHIKAQQRRDELFNIQEELRLTNAKLLSLNVDLEKARATAVAERDLRTRFMNQVSHELRTPINTVVNFAHILSQGGLGTVTERQIDYLSRIEKSGWHSMSVLNDLLDMAQMNAGEFRLKKERVDVKAICEEVMAGTRGLLENQDVELVRDYPNIWPEILVDPKRFQQALLNLLGNAAKYTDKGRITLRVRTEGDMATFAVEDTGMGIAKEHYDAVFQEFRQLDETIARRRVGTGLGLPISRHLIERHGGTITLTSVVGEGSTFTISLPLASGQEATPDPLVAETIAPEESF